MTPEDFRQLLSGSKDAELLNPCLRDDPIPYVFSADEAAWGRFRGAVSGSLGVAPDDIRVIGSGRFGFSLKPGNNLKAYTADSDVDVVIINPKLFDELWYGLLRAAYPRPPMLDKIGGWLKARQNEVYTGWLTPLSVRLDAGIYGTRARPVQRFNSSWFRTFQSAARHIQRRHERVNSRLYRTWEHAEMYHQHSIAALRASLSSGTA